MTKAFGQEKAGNEHEVQEQAAVDRFERSGNQLGDWVAGGRPLGDAAAKFGLKVTTVAAADLGGNDPDGKPVALPVAKEEILKTAFATERGDSSRVVETQDGSIFAVHLDKVIAPRVRPPAEVKDKAVAAWQ